MKVTVEQLLAIHSPEDAAKLIALCVRNGYKFRPIGDVEANAGAIELATEPASPLIERVTNMIDAMLELQAEVTREWTHVKSPRDGAERWFGIPHGRVQYLSDVQRRLLADNIVVTFADSGAGKDKLPTVIFRDRGIGQHPTDLHKTILSLSKGNKVDKFYLSGAYGQGGSSTYAFCQYSVILSRRDPRCLGGKDDGVGWTIVRVNERDETYKSAIYEYLVDSVGDVPVIASDYTTFDPGTYIAHLAYRASSLGKSVGLEGYRVFNTSLFDPVLPFWIRDPRNKVNRSMGGNTSRLHGNEVVEYQAEATKILPTGDALVIRYWVIRAQVDESSNLWSYLERKNADTVLITLNGQKQGALQRAFIKHPDVGLSFLSNYMLLQVECDSLNLKNKRGLFSSTRERIKTGEPLDLLKIAIKEVLTEDEQLYRLEHERKQQQSTQMDEKDRERAYKLLGKYISRHFPAVKEASAASEAAQSGVTSLSAGGDKSTTGNVLVQATKERETKPRAVTPPPPVISPSDPPTFLRAVSADPLQIPRGGKAVLKLECDAPDDFLTREHSGALTTGFANMPLGKVDGSTKLSGGRMKMWLTLPSTVDIGSMGDFTVQLSRPGLDPLLCTCAIVAADAPTMTGGPGKAPTATPVPSVPPFEIKPVQKGDLYWNAKSWDQHSVADYEFSERLLTFYVSIDNAEFAKEMNRKKSADMQKSFRTKYQAMIAYNLWLHFQKERVGQGLSEEGRQEELQRTASTVILSMRADNDDDSDDE